MEEPKIVRKGRITDIAILKQRKVLIIAVFCMTILLITSSYALLSSFDVTDNVVTFETGNLNMTVNNVTGLLNLNESFPESDEEGLSNATPITLTFTNTGTLPINHYIVKLVSEEGKVSTLSEDFIKFAISIDGISYGKPMILSKTDNIIYEGYKLKVGASETIYLKVWLDENATNAAIGKVYYGSIKVELYQEYINKSVANPPIMSSNMIPIKWDGSKWVKAIEANTGNEWYDYENKKWANAVTVTSAKRAEYISAGAGTEIKEEDILTYFVWIPRYKYNLFNSGNGTSKPEQEIEIRWESGTATTGTVSCTIASNGTENCTDIKNGSIVNGTSTYTHPAFTFGEEEKTGFWVGKFETTGTIGTACTNATCTTGSLTIKPDVTSLRDKNVSNMYYAARSMNRAGNAYGFSSTEVDTHMMKNIEWGAVAYLTQSKYGRCDSGTCTEISINNSAGYYTGRSGGAPGGSNATYASFFGTGGTEQYNTSGYYTYNDKKITCTGATCTSTSTIDNYTISEVKEEGKGTSASTTGNIYGVYDMGGGANEYVMGNMVNGDGSFYPSASGFNDTTILYPESKYYDRYVYDASSLTTHNRGHLGDTTRETLKTYGSTGGGWYNDYASFPRSSFSWFTRGGYYKDGTSAGSFFFANDSGFAHSNYSLRVISHTQ